MNNVSSQYGRTALQHASHSGHTDVVKLLVDSGAKIDNKDRVSTEPSKVLSIVIVLPLSPSPPPPPPHTLSVPPTLVPLSPFSVML